MRALGQWDMGQFKCGMQSYECGMQITDLEFGIWNLKSGILESFDDEEGSVVVEEFAFGKIGDAFADVIDHFFGGQVDAVEDAFGKTFLAVLFAIRICRLGDAV